MKIVIGARKSQLSRKQVDEVVQELLKHSPHLKLEVIWTITTGDLDQKSSLVNMEKTNFFTKEIDQMVINRRCCVGIHSAKDLPDPLPKGLKIVAITKGKTSLDSLVMRNGHTFNTIRKNALIGASSIRRNKVIQDLRSDLQCIEVRGSIENRLSQLFSHAIDGLVVAEAALIRLNLTHLNRIPLPGNTPPLQGKLAVVAREGDTEVEQVFQCLDIRKKKKSLYVGLSTKNIENVTHLPLIKIVPRKFDSSEIASVFADIFEYTHIIFTSKNAVDIFFDCLKYYGYTTIQEKKCLCIGQITAQRLRKKGVEPYSVALDETQEGIIQVLSMEEDLGQSYILLPQSSKARPALAQTLVHRQIRHQLCYLYDTHVKIPHVKPNLEDFDEIIFTSPSTVEAFIEVFGLIPKDKKLTSIGPITNQKLKFL